MTTPLIADRQYTIETYLTRSKRKALPLDRRFVRRRIDNNRPTPGPLSVFVRRAREPALEQYLLAHAFASSDKEGQFDVRLPASTWARAIGGHILDDGTVEKAALHLVSRNWAFLEHERLVHRERKGRRTRIWLRADDGEGGPYQLPGAGSLGKTLEDGEPGYLQLPFEYWREHWHEKLELAAKAMLLIGLSLGNGFQLPTARMREWYGISASTAARGLDELRGHGLLHREKHRRPEPESPTGSVEVYYYALLEPFGPRGKKAKSCHPAWLGPPPRPQATTVPPAARRQGRPS